MNNQSLSIYTSERKLSNKYLQRNYKIGYTHLGEATLF